MNLALLSLVGFAAFTIAVPLGAVAVYRWSHILTGRRPVHEFGATPRRDDADWYRRAMRAHANCVENLPVMSALVLVAHVADADDRAFGRLAAFVLLARFGQAAVHMGFAETARVVTVRFAFFLAQWVAFVVMVMRIVRH